MRAHRFNYFLKRAGLVFLSSLMMASVGAAGQTVSVSRASGRGVFNIGPSKGTLSFAPGEENHTSPLRLVYETPSGSMVGVWTKGYPATLAAGTITAVEVFVKCQTVEQSREVSVAMEIKGDKEVQRISVPLRAGWASIPSAIDWDRIGALREVVFVVAPMGGARKGTLLFDAVFSDMKIAPKKVAGVVGVTESSARGIFNIKTAEGTVSPVIDPAAKKEVLQFTYSATAGSFVGVWTKGYPSELNAKNFNGVKAAVKGPASLSKEVSVVLEIKGTLAVQKIALPIQPSWTMSPHLVEWSRIGDLREVVFVLAPIGGARRGSLLLDMSFVKLPGVKPPVPGTFSLSDARGRGIFNMGPAELSEGSVFEPTLGREVPLLTISAPAKSIVGYWSKEYPAGLSARSVNGVQSSFLVPESAIGKFKGFLELKGTGKEIQRVPFPMQAGWNTIREPLDWALLGSLREAVFVVQPNTGLDRLETTVAFDLQFSKGHFVRELPKAPPLPENLSALYGSSSTAVAGTSYSVNQAGAMGVFSIRESEGVIEKGQVEGSEKQLLKFDYRCPASTVVGIWTKDYPADLNRETVDGVVIAAYVPKEAQPSEINLSLELKGDKVQLVPLTLQPGWNVVRQALQWTALGSLKEAVFVVVPKSGGERTGTVFLNLDFMKGDFRAKALGLSWTRKLLGMFLGALGLAGLVGLFQKVIGKSSVVRSADASLPSLGATLLTGMAVALTGACALAIYALGTVPQQQTMFLGLLVSGAGVAIAELYKFARTKTHLTSGEVFQNFFLTGILWATASGQVLWQVPTQWDNVIMKSHLAVALVCLIYHGANGVRLATSGKHLRPITGAILVGTPFLFGALLVLETPALLQSLGALLVGGKGPAVWAAREVLGRFMVLFVVNELITQAVGLAAKGQWVKSAKSHGWVALMTVGVVAAPYIADAGCGTWVAALPVGWSVLSALVSVMLSQAGLWMEAYFVTGIMLDGLYGYAPTAGAISRHGLTGLKKGMAFSALFMGLLYAIKGLVNIPGAVHFFVSSPIPAGVLLGALVFPLFKTIIETFDGSMSFIQRAQYSYRQWPLYLRGAAAGGLFALGISTGVSDRSTGDRLWFGFLAGAAVFGGVSVLRDVLTGFRQKGHIQNVRVYLVESLLGGAIGGLVAFYLDTVQVTALVNKFAVYTSAGLPKTDFTVYSLVSKWGRVDLGGYTGGVKLFFDEALAGLITWSIAAPLFSINRAFMIAYFQKDKAPVRYFFSKAGAAELSVNLIHVMRWGLWMSPIINSGIHMMAKATWYNQDGAIRTLVAIFKNLTLNPTDFQVWSLGVFVSLLSYNVLRVLIWIDHMGLRVATLVNLSFLGMDRLDERIARFIGPSAAQRYLPESVKRFTTWAPLLIPFYIPRGENWDFAWTKSQEIQNAAAEATSFAQKLLALGWRPVVIYLVLGALGVSLLLAGLKILLRRSAARRPATATLANREYKVTVQADGAAYSQIAAKGFDLTRRSYDVIDPAGRALFLVEKTAGAGSPFWPVMGNAPTDQFELSRLESGTDSIQIVNASHNLRATVEITLPDADSTAERWAVTIENPTDAVRDLKVVPYLEWVLDQAGSDRGHTQYVRLFPEMEYVAGSNAVVVNQRKTKTMGFIASDLPAEGFHSSRMDFIGRARSLWSPRLLETLAFLPPIDTKPYPTFDPIGSLLIGLRVEAKSKRTVHFLVGYAKNREQALSMVQSGLKPQSAPAIPAAHRSPKTGPLVGHGEIPPGTPLPYSVYEDGGNTLVVRTPFTPRPYDHALSNIVGHYVMVTNRGLHTTSNGNSQQNPSPRIGRTP
jgi:cyclic beta-1,2-glucan synthetase